MINKMKIQITFENNKGELEAKPITVEAEVPSYEDFDKIKNFRESFDMLERRFLKARKEASEAAIANYMEEVSKKKAKSKMKSSKEESK